MPHAPPQESYPELQLCFVAHSHSKFHLGSIKRFFPEYLYLQESSQAPPRSLLTLSPLTMLVYLSLCPVTRVSVAFWFPRPPHWESAFIWFTSFLISTLSQKARKTRMEGGVYQMMWWLGHHDMTLGERNVSGPVGRGNSPEKLRMECGVEKAAGSKRRCEDLVHGM